MPPIADLIRLLDDPTDADAFDRAFGEPESLDLDENLLPPLCDRPYWLREAICHELAEFGPDARDAVPALLRCAEDVTDSLASRSMRLAVVTALWKVSGDPARFLPICERLLADRECWFRRQVVELLEEIGHPAALPALQERLADVRLEVRQAAAQAMAKIGLRP